MKRAPEEKSSGAFFVSIREVSERMRAIALIAVALAGCTAQADGALREGSSAAAPAPVTLAGEWRVAGIDGQDFDEPYGIALSADGDHIWWSPRCAGQTIDYNIDGNNFEAVSPPPPPVVCAIGYPERLPQVMAAILAAERIERTPANGIRLSGDGRSLTLFAQ